MAKRVMHIPEYQLPSSAKDGVEVTVLSDLVPADFDRDTYRSHRDQHYLLVIAASGSVETAIDFESIHMEEPFVSLISPTQVHRVIQLKDFKGYLVSFDVALMPTPMKPVLEAYFLRKKVHTGNRILLANLKAIVNIINQHKKTNPSFNSSVGHTLLHAMLALLVADIDIQQAQTIGNRTKQIERDFLQLLQKRFREWKKPADFANALHISVSHLNDTLKATTGHSVSTQIQRHVVTEAKRLLYYTDANIQEIAYMLGYEDTAYFIRLFKKITEVTPLAFRRKIRD